VRTGSQIALVADDPDLAHAIGAHVKRNVGTSVLVSSYLSIREYLGPRAQGVLVLAAASVADAEQALCLAQETILQQWPLVLVAVMSNASACWENLQCLEAYQARLLRWPKDAARLTRLIREHDEPAEKTFGKKERDDPEAIIRATLADTTPSLLPLTQRIAAVAANDGALLLTGESGAGKTTLARLIHELSPRKAARFLVFPCGALSVNLLDRELFGDVEDVCTEADCEREGKLVAVGNGTVLLDEIDALGLQQQAKLLRVLETGEFEAVGSSRTQVCGARIIATSNCDLEMAQRLDKFRSDLYCKLNVTSIHLPPLRERPQDIVALARHMAARFNTRFHKDLFKIHPEALAALEAFSWPGNIRQLENVIMHAVLVSSGPDLILEDLPLPVQEGNLAAPGSLAATLDPLLDDRDRAERALVEQALANCGYSRARTAHVLGISRVTLYKRMKKFGLMNVPQHS